MPETKPVAGSYEAARQRDGVNATARLDRRARSRSFASSAA
ncbi:hypothetical protein ACR42A_28625 [Burkholderia gladioli]|nr:hypothetical protein [Burkholderia gladioli]